jgi:hypothetical protein
MNIRKIIIDSYLQDKNGRLGCCSPGSVPERIWRLRQHDFLRLTGLGTLSSRIITRG